MGSASDQAALDVETIYVAADAVVAAYKAMRRIPWGRRSAVDTMLDRSIYPGDLDDLAKKLKALADEWQVELDAEVS